MARAQLDQHLYTFTCKFSARIYLEVKNGLDDAPLCGTCAKRNEAKRAMTNEREKQIAGFGKDVSAKGIPE
jgi:hypothetical protein